MPRARSVHTSRPAPLYISSVWRKLGGEEEEEEEEEEEVISMQKQSVRFFKIVALVAPALQHLSAQEKKVQTITAHDQPGRIQDGSHVNPSWI